MGRVARILFGTAVGCPALIVTVLLLSGAAAYGQQASKASLRHSASAKALTAQERAFELNEAGVELILKGEKERGVAKLNEALRQDPNCTTALYNLSGYYLLEGDPKQALTLIERAVNLEPNDVSFLKRLAETEFANSDLDSAREVFERVTRVAPRDDQALLHLGTIYGMNQQWDDAERTLRKAAELRSDDPQILLAFANVLVVRERYGEAVPLLRTVQEKRPSAEGATALGVAYAGIGDLEQALRSYTRARELNSTDPLLEKHISAVRQALAERAENER